MENFRSLTFVFIKRATRCTLQPRNIDKHRNYARCNVGKNVAPNVTPYVAPALLAKPKNIKIFCFLALHLLISNFATKIKAACS